jgi:hypothetical protein
MLLNQASYCYCILQSMCAFARSRQIYCSFHFFFSKLPKRLLTAWLPQKRPVGRPELTYGHTVVRTVRAAEEAGGFVGPAAAPVPKWEVLAGNRAVWVQLCQQLRLGQGSLG